MIDRLNKLYTQDKNKLYKDIWQHQNNNDTTLINFLYFANVVKNHLPNRKKDIQQKTYYNNLMSSDFLLPDGIALQTFYRVAHKLGYVPTKKIPNLNGTDFVPYFLDKAQKDRKKMLIHLYGASEETIQKAKKYFKQYANIGYTHHGYGNLDDKEIQELVQKLSPTHTNILLIGRGTPTQENRAHKYQHFLSHTMIFTVGGLFDFMT